MSEQERHKRHRFLCVSRDPEASACRIFMSGLDTTKVNKADIIDLFSPFGQIYGKLTVMCSTLKGLYHSHCQCCGRSWFLVKTNIGYASNTA